jgi:hypothetical protein
MSIHTRRNSLVGYTVLRVLERKLERRRRRRQLQRNAWKIALVVGLGIVSLGILAGIAGVAFRRQQADADVLEELAEDAEEDESEVVGEVVTAPEPIAAT